MSCCKGELRIKEINGEETVEKFLMPVEYWNSKDYERQWKEGLGRIKTDDISCLIVAIQDPKKNARIDIWDLYRIGNTIHIQNRLLLKDSFNMDLITPDNCYQLIVPKSPKTFIDEDGEEIQISEWEVFID